MLQLAVGYGQHRNMCGYQNQLNISLLQSNVYTFVLEKSIYILFFLICSML